MSFDSLPDIPRPENPEHDWLKKEAEKTVTDRVAELEIGLDLDKHPELRSRLAEIGSHFEDSLAMAGIIRTVYAELRAELALEDDRPERLMRAAVLHDIGKSGPAGRETALNFAVRRLFIPPRRPFNPYSDGRAKTVREFAAEQGFADSEDLLEELRKSGIDPDQEPMIVFWRRHAEWTYDLLRTDPGPDIDDELIAIAASHHLIEGQNPAGLDLREAPAEAQVLEVLEEADLLAAVDKYQAFRSRGGLDHAETLSRLAKMIEERSDLPDPLRSKFLRIIDVLERSKGALDRYFENIHQ